MPRLARTSLFLASAIALGAFHETAKVRPADKDLRDYLRGFETPRAWKGKYAPEFTLVTLDGDTFRLSDHVGREIVILNFFATWCGPCRAEMPELARYLDAQPDRPITLVGIDANEARSQVEKFMNDVGVPFPVAIDERQVQEAYGVTAFPTTVVIGVDGRIQLYETGAIMNADVALDPVVRTVWADLAAHRGVTRDVYLDGVAHEDYHAVRDRADDDHGNPAGLTGRARQIADRMPCPCGCSDTVSACTCKTSKGIKARLAQGQFGDKTDTEIMTELNREFCMKSM